MNKFTILLIFSIPLFSQTTLNVHTFGATGNGATNDTSSINSALSSACTTPANLYFPTGTYLVDPLTPLSSCGITIFGDGSNFSILKLNSASTNVMLNFTAGGGKNLTINDLQFNGQHFEVAGVDADGYTSITVARVNVHDFGTPGFAEGHTTDLDGMNLAHTTNVSVANSTFNGCERMGLELQGVKNSIVSNSTMNNNGSMGAYSEQTFSGTLAGPVNVQWIGNTFTSNGGGGTGGETDPSLIPVQVNIVGNTVSNSGNDNWGFGWGLVIGAHAYGTISCNKVINQAASVPSSAYTNGITWGSDVGPVVISDNTVTGTKTYGILASPSSGTPSVNIIGNIISSQQNGIFVYQTPGITITKNNISNSSVCGITMSLSTPYVVSGNIFSGNAANTCITP